MTSVCNCRTIVSADNPLADVRNNYNGPQVEKADADLTFFIPVGTNRFLTWDAALVVGSGGGHHWTLTSRNRGGAQ
jgi:hypothetical protein